MEITSRGSGSTMLRRAAASAASRRSLVLDGDTVTSPSSLLGETGYSVLGIVADCDTGGGIHLSGVLRMLLLRLTELIFSLPSSSCWCRDCWGVKKRLGSRMFFRGVIGGTAAALLLRISLTLLYSSSLILSSTSRCGPLAARSALATTPILPPLASSSSPLMLPRFGVLTAWSSSAFLFLVVAMMIS